MALGVLPVPVAVWPWAGTSLVITGGVLNLARGLALGGCGGSQFRSHERSQLGRAVHVGTDLVAEHAQD